MPKPYLRKLEYGYFFDLDLSFLLNRELAYFMFQRLQQLSTETPATKSERDAKELQSKLIKKKLANVQVTQSTADSGSVWYRVMVGPFQNRSMLNKAQDVLVQMNFSPLERKR